LEEVYFYGAQGEKLGRFGYGSGVFTTLRRTVYFGSRVLTEGLDRLGSWWDQGGYYPYGEAQNSGFNDFDKFATYYRDGTSLLDYARNRYYSSTLGRFISADPFVNSAGLGDPGSWNRYAYAGGDPVNRFDPGGLCDQDPNYSVTVCGTSDPLGFMDSQYSLQYWYRNDPGMFNWFMVQTGGGGSGGPKQRILQVTNVQKSGRDYDQVENRFWDIENAIDPDCLSFLQSGGGNLGSYVGDLLSNNLLAVANFTSNIAAFTNSAGSTLPPGTAAITVNDTGAFFSNRFTVDQGNLIGGTARAQVFILLHELGHALGAQGFRPDLNDRKAGKANDKLVDTNCKKTLSEFRSQ
jgi:RHS repeat-associated protein